MTQLIEWIVEALVDYPEEVVVTETTDSGTTTYELSVHKDDMGKVIGKQGRIVKSIRTVVYAAATNRNERVHFEVN